jgi:hypothetical protein
LLGSFHPLDTHMFMINAIAIVSVIVAAAFLLLEKMSPDTILAVLCCFA